MFYALPLIQRSRRCKTAVKMNCFTVFTILTFVCSIFVVIQFICNAKIAFVHCHMQQCFKRSKQKRAEYNVHAVAQLDHSAPKKSTAANPLIRYSASDANIIAHHLIQARDTTLVDYRWSAPFTHKPQQINLRMNEHYDDVYF